MKLIIGCHNLRCFSSPASFFAFTLVVLHVPMSQAEVQLTVSAKHLNNFLLFASFQGTLVGENLK
jgi:hypothetical protein